MVQRKVENKLGTKLESKKSIKSEKRAALKTLQCQEELKTKMKKARSLKKASELEKCGEHENLRLGKPGVDQTSSVSSKKKVFPTKISSRSPNYMKPTNSSDARKESLQVSSNQIADKKISHYSNNLRHGNKGSSQPRSLSGSSLKPVRILTKNSSCKSMRCSMKASRIPLYPMNKATCSSILKGSKFPASVILNPGGTESEGTSVVKVCPYTYCSLNGHHLATLPPLKRFLSARRRSLKTQKKSKELSKKSKELSPFKFRNPDEAKEINTEQVILTRDSSISEADMVSSNMSVLVEDDFFVDIHASPTPEPAEKITGRDGPKHELVQTIDTESENEVSNELPNDTDEDDLLHQNHDLPAEENDLANELHYKQAETDSDICIGSDLDEDRESIAAIQVEEIIYEASDMDWEEQKAPYSDNKTDNYTFSNDGSDLETVSSPDEQIFEPDYLANTCTETHKDTQILQEKCEEDNKSSEAAICGRYSESEDTELYRGDRISEKDALSDGDEVSDICNGQAQNQLSEVFDLGQIPIELESFYHLDQSSKRETEEIDIMGTIENIVCSSNSSNSLDIASEEFAKVNEDRDDNPESEEGEKLDNNGASIIQECDSLRNDQETKEFQVNPVTDGLQEGTVIKGQVSETDKIMVTSNQSKDQSSLYIDLNERMEIQEQVDDTGSLLDIQICDSHQGDSETDQETSEEDQNPDKIHKKIELKGSQTRSNLKEKMNTKCKPVSGDQNAGKKFNPREPRYLEIEPDPDAEKVDLRHRSMDERKNAEEWMVDYALRQAVIKLAPARKMRVALLVEAFETVMPPAKCETHLRHSTASFTHARPIQACS